MIAVFAAMDAEAQPLLRAASLRGSGETAGFPVTHADFAGSAALVCRTGLGRRAAEAAEAVLASFSAKAVLSVGTAGGLSPTLSAGDVIICERVSALASASAHNVEPGVADPGLLAAAMKAGEQAGLTARVVVQGLFFSRVRDYAIHRQGTSMTKGQPCLLSAVHSQP